MEPLLQKLDVKLREWKPETAAQVRQFLAELIDLADHDAPGIERSQAVEQAVLGLADGVRGRPGSRFLPAEAGRTNVAQPFCGDSVIRTIDEMIERVDRFRIDPGLTRQVEVRSALAPDFSSGDCEILGRMIALIAYSNNARADKVSHLIESGVFGQVFHDYSVEEVARLAPEAITRARWQDLRANPIQVQNRSHGVLRQVPTLDSRSARFVHGLYQRYGNAYGPEVGAGHSSVLGKLQVYRRVLSWVRASLLQESRPMASPRAFVCR
jgi:hypothetical protein